MAHSLSDFLAETADRPQNTGAFEVENERILQVNLGTAGSSGAALAQLWIKHGSMIAYRGEIGFERQGMLEQGIGNFLKKAVSGEGATLTRATGRGQLYLADGGKRVTVLKLNGESIFVNGNDLLAFEPTVHHEITMMRKLSAMMSGGLFNVKLSGNGVVAVVTHGRPLTLVVAPGQPVFTDPQATVAWSGGLTPDYKTDFQLKTLLGRGSGESFQMKFDAGSGGAGFVIVQPYEERFAQADG
ncbi:MAG TPA: AIM24 family protein [Phycisphaerales bacterium]|nr:AIM24 family protein [Phycisphaerales bacterium]